MTDTPDFDASAAANDEFASTHDTPEVVTASASMPGTWRVADGSAVAFKDAIVEWGAAAHKVLFETATRYNAFVTYLELSERVQNLTGIRTRSQMRNWIGKVLAVVVEECARRGESPRVMAVRAWRPVHTPRHSSRVWAPSRTNIFNVRPPS